MGQKKVDSKSNEKTAIPELLKSLDLKGSLISCDAAGCQVKNADLIVEKGGDYLLAVKQDHKHLYAQVAEWMVKRKTRLAEDVWTDFGSGRIEQRSCYVENQLDLLDVVYREDRSRTKTGNAAENITTARKLALQLLNQMQDKESIKNKRKMAGWDDGYLLTVLQNLSPN